MYFLSKYRRGIFNRYRKGMPLSEMMLKDASAWFRGLLLRLKYGKVPTLLLFPHYPSRGSTIYRITRALKWDLTNRLDRHADLAIYWEYATIREEYEPLESAEKIRVINLRSRNISKDVVDDQMREAFGYSTRIDPKNHQGTAVRKSLTNAVHDGQPISCPCEPEPGYIYQKRIDSSVNDKEVMDLRVPVMSKHIPHLYLNYRFKDEPFKNVPDRAELVLDISIYLSEEEIARILHFCELSGMEFGELDILRDRGDGRIYIVDANNTPQGPPLNLSPSEKKRAIASLAGAFEEAFTDD